MKSHNEIREMLAAYELNLLNPEERGEIDRHVRLCDECFQELYEFSPVAEQFRRRRAPRSQLHAGKLLLAASLAVIATVAIWLYQLQIQQPSGYRGDAAIQLLSPVGMHPVSPPVEFRWNPVRGAAFYRIYVSSPEQMWLAGTRVGATMFRWTPENGAPSGRYVWRVEAYASESMKLSESFSAEFSLIRK